MALSGVLLMLLLTLLLSTLNESFNQSINEQELNNLLLLHKQGLITGAKFNIEYKPIINGTLIINQESVTLNNASRPNNGLALITCYYESLLITNEGLSCLNH
jgi:hypothetical protein